MNEKEITALALAAFENGEACRIKLPPANKIHDFNMAVNALLNKGYIEISKRNMTEIILELTDAGLDAALSDE